MSPVPEFRPTRFQKSNPDGSGGSAAAVGKSDPKPTRTQSAVEIVLFTIFGVFIALAAIALYTVNSSQYKKVPNTVDVGLRGDRVNILLFGIGGDSHPQHDQLADSIMLVSLKPSTRQVAVVSVPRDLWVRVGSYGVHRINYAHEVGNQSGYPGAGPGLLCDTVSRVFGQPVHAFVRIDFSAFEKLIDSIGGIDVYCERGFYDQLFHDGFTRGWHHLDGKRALAYARYRYIVGPEGDNFGRELRQQQILSAVRDKLQRLSPQNALRVLQATMTFSDAAATNLTPRQMLTLYRRFHDVRPQNIRHVSLKPLTEIFEVTRVTEPGEAVRVPRDDYTGVRNLETNVFSSEGQVSTPDEIRLADVPPSSQRQTVISAAQ